ncbi:MAG TPA: DNA-3-methyladenine glycosylase [Candidatus Caenarcaniphilales bacterium]
MDQTSQIVEASWLARPSTAVASDLIGCTLVRYLPDGQVFRGLIVETEAYGPNDPACHAYVRRTQRNFVMFGPAGFTYIYLIYGMYYCLNIVTDGDGIASAVLVRALELTSIPAWIDASQAQKPHRIAAGPGKLCRALQIDLSLTGQALQVGQGLWLEHRSSQLQQALDHQAKQLVQTTRIGLTRGKDLPWRWYLAACASVSRP